MLWVKKHSQLLPYCHKNISFYPRLLDNGDRCGISCKALLGGHPIPSGKRSLRMDDSHQGQLLGEELSVQ
jgi:hypothetical protein